MLWLHKAMSSRKDKSKDVDVYRSKSLYKFSELDKGVSSENNRTFWFKNFGDKCTIKTSLVAMTISKEGGSAEHHSIFRVRGTVLTPPMHSVEILQKLTVYIFLYSSHKHGNRDSESLRRPEYPDLQAVETRLQRGSAFYCLFACFAQLGAEKEIEIWGATFQFLENSKFLTKKKKKPQFLFLRLSGGSSS